MTCLYRSTIIAARQIGPTLALAAYLLEVGSQLVYLIHRLTATLTDHNLKEGFFCMYLFVARQQGGSALDDIDLCKK